MWGRQAGGAPVTPNRDSLPALLVSQVCLTVMAGGQPLFWGYLPSILPSGTPVSHSLMIREWSLVRTPWWPLVFAPSPWAPPPGWAAHPPSHTSHRWNPCHPPWAVAGSGTPCSWSPEQLHFWARTLSGSPHSSSNKPTVCWRPCLGLQSLRLPRGKLVSCAGRDNTYSSHHLTLRDLEIKVEIGSWDDEIFYARWIPSII